MPRWDYSKLADFLETHLPAYALRLIRQVEQVSHSRGFKLYLVGGGAREVMRAFVRQTSPEDLQYFVLDLDFAVEGDAVALAEAAAHAHGGDLVRNLPFLTAKWITPNGYAVDFSTCRREAYPVPGSLPEVLGTADIYEDLLRRDFTVNSLAVSLSRDDFGSLLDPLGGVGDVFTKTLRILHEASFFDDPTRITRAIRYCTRLNYRMDHQTALALQQGIEESYFDLVSPERIRYELECIFSENYWFGMIWFAHTSGILSSIHPAWRQLPTTSGQDAEVLELGIRNQGELLEQEMIPSWLVRLSWSLLSVPPDLLGSLLDRIGMHRRLARSMLEARRKYEEVKARMNHPGFCPSRIYRVCKEYSRKTLLFIVFNSYLDRDTEPLRRNLLKHLRDLSPRRAVLQGQRLVNLGLPPGPLIEKAQEELWWLKIDGKLPDQNTVERAAREIVQRYLSQPMI